jgi:TetR/AcrR family transcriptional regulator, cholesterol catabolism regulator
MGTGVGRWARSTPAVLDHKLKGRVLQNGRKRIRLSNRREMIIIAAARLFHERGFDGTTVRDLARAVHLQSGSLFAHFSTKEEILLAVLEDGARNAVDTLEGCLETVVTPRQKLSALVHCHLEMILGKNRAGFAIVVTDWRALSPEARKRVVALRDLYESCVARTLDEVAQAGLISKDTRVFRLFLLGALNWTLRWYQSDGELSVDQLAERFLSLILSFHPAERDEGSSTAAAKKNNRTASRRGKALMPRRREDRDRLIVHTS